MTQADSDPHATLDGAGDEHAGDAHHVGGGHDHAHSAGHGHADEHAAELGQAHPGPIDWGAWLVAIVGIAAGSVIALVLAQTIAHG